MSRDLPSYDIFSDVISILQLCNQIIALCDNKDPSKPALPHCGKFQILMTSIISLLSSHFDVHSRTYNASNQSKASKSASFSADRDDKDPASPLETLIHSTQISGYFETLQRLLIAARNTFEDASKIRVKLRRVSKFGTPLRDFVSDIQIIHSQISDILIPRSVTGTTDSQHSTIELHTNGPAPPTKKINNISSEPVMAAATKKILTQSTVPVPVATEPKNDSGTTTDKTETSDTGKDQSYLKYQAMFLKGEKECLEGHCFYFGHSMAHSIDMNRAFQLYEKSANLGYIPAMNYLGCMYITQLYVLSQSQSLVTRSLNHLSLSYNYYHQKQMHFHNNIELSCLIGLNKIDLIEKSVYWLERAHKLGNTDATYNLAMIYLNFNEFNFQSNQKLTQTNNVSNSTNVQKCVELLEIAANKGHVPSQYKLGLLYESKHSTSNSLFQNEFGQNHSNPSDKQFKLINSFQNPDNPALIETNTEKSIRWYRQACLNKHMPAMNKLGVLLIDLGSNVTNPKDSNTKENVGTLLNKQLSSSLAQAARNSAADTKTTKKPEKRSHDSSLTSSENVINFAKNDQTQWFDEGLRWLTMAAENGFAPAQNNLGQYYQNTMTASSTHLQKSTERVEKLSASRGDVGSKNDNYTVALEWFSKASAQAYVPAIINIGKLKLKQKQFESAYYYFIEATRIAFGVGGGIDSHITSYRGQNYVIMPQFDIVGDSSLFQNNDIVMAWYYLGLMYEKGFYVVSNLDIAIQYYKKAAQYQHPKAMLKLGDSYFSGHGSKQSYAKALEMYRQLAMNTGNVIACNNLGIMHEEGLGCEIDLETSKMWFEMAVEKDYFPAQENLNKLQRKIENDSKASNIDNTIKKLLVPNDE